MTFRAQYRQLIVLFALYKQLDIAEYNFAVSDTCINLLQRLIKFELLIQLSNLKARTSPSY